MHIPLSDRTVGTLTYTNSGLFIVSFWLLFGDSAISAQECSTMCTITVLVQQCYAFNLLMSLFKEALPKMLFPCLRFSQFASAAGMVPGLSTLGLSVTQGPELDFSGDNYQLTLRASGMFAAVAVLPNFFLMQRVNPESRSSHIGCHSAVGV